MAEYSLADRARSGIYAIVHTASGKRYVGSAKRIGQRWLEHQSLLRRGVHHSPPLQASWNKYGEPAFRFEILDFCDATDCVAREQAFIDLGGRLFNVCKTAGSSLGRIHSDETKAKIRARAVGRVFPPRSAEYRAAISAALQGKQKAPEHQAALHRGRLAQVYTDERKARVSASLRATYADGTRSREKTEAHKQKIGQFYAKLSDEEVRQIRQLRASGVTGVALAAQFKSNSGTISAICSGKRYRWVT